jgi:hypothetical protein
MPNGTFTVDLGDGYVTLRLAPVWWPEILAGGAQVAAFMRGPNYGHCTEFAYVIEREVRVWDGFHGAHRQIAALSVLVAGGPVVAYEAGETYARASGCCWRCDRPLTVPASLLQGLGPVCAEKLGVANEVQRRDRRPAT